MLTLSVAGQQLARGLKRPGGRCNIFFNSLQGITYGFYIFFPAKFEFVEKKGLTRIVIST